jgi:hypothetical protein
VVHAAPVRSARQQVDAVDADSLHARVLVHILLAVGDDV